VSRTGHNAVATAKQFVANYASTDFDEVLADPEVDAVLLSTRHHLHASMTLQALKAGKHVLVEKPLALNVDELDLITKFYNENDTHPPILLTGFNRRFSPIMQRIQTIVSHRSNPMILNYRMNVGYIPLDNWVHGAEGGGRNRGEACHIYDLFTFLTDSRVVSVSTQRITPKTSYYGINDNFVVTMSFADGSVATLTYTALGSTTYPKEQLEIFVDGKVITMHDYKNFNVLGAKIKSIQHNTPEKGQQEELVAFAKSILHDGVWPIPFWQQIQATQISFQVEEQLKLGTEKSYSFCE
jgi:predicted dehydrogenase